MPAPATWRRGLGCVLGTTSRQESAAAVARVKAVLGCATAWWKAPTGPGADYLKVFQIAGTTAWVAHSFGVIPDAIWFGRPWSNTIKDVVDGVVYGLLTAGVFGWLWP